MNELALFAGVGGGILGGHLLGWRTVCAVEWEAYPASVLCARQNDKVLPTFPIWDDVQTFDGKPWRGIVDVVSGGFPCQDISAAGKGAGIDGERSGMWGEMARIIHEVQPRFVFVENSPMLTSRGLGRVLGDLATMGFDAKWGVLGAADVGANHQRDRIWIVGKKMGNSNNDGHTTSKIRNSITQGSNPSKTGQKQACEFERSSEQNAEMAHSSSQRLQRYWYERINDQSQRQQAKSGHSIVDWCGDWWKAEPIVGRVADGVAHRVDRLKAIGNGQVPLCAATAWRILSESL
jgi:DNA (cytosine-5)-methyltransferase 1